jgi:malate synthase
MSLPTGVQLTLPIPKGYESVISKECLEFLAVLHRTFNARRLELLENRKKIQEYLDQVSLGHTSVAR